MATSKKQPVTIVKALDTQEEKMKALQTALAEIEKNYGKGAVMKLGQGFVANVESISTGSLGLDMALGVGGVPKGRIVEIFGHESSGKTTVSLQIVAQCQKNGGIAAFIDVEHALDPSYAKALGVNIDELLISQPDTGDQALEIAEHLIRSGAVDIIVVDSVAAMVPREEITGGMAESQVGLQARLMSKGMRKLAGVINKYKCCAIFINQIREMMGGQSFSGGPTTTTPGGRALKFFSTVRIEVNRAGAVKNNTDEQIGNRVRCKVVKNKVAPPFKIIEFDMIFGKGSSLAGEVLDYGETLGIISRSGAWYSYGETRMGMGREQARAYLEENPEFMEKIVDELKENTDKFLLVYRKDGKPALKEEKTAKGSKSAKSAKSEPPASSYDADIDVEPNEEDFE